MNDQSWSEQVKNVWWTIKRNPVLKFGLATVILIIAVVGIVFGVFSYYGQLPWSPQTSNTTVSVSDEPIAVDSSDSQPLPIGVMIENLVTIRPQYGLAAASVVYEALVEGGITRFLAIYPTLPDTMAKLGPIRSTRSYFVDWVEEYGAVYAYVGGSPEALGVTDSSNYITDLNQFYHPAYYYRDPELVAPHNLFSSAELLNNALRDLDLTAEQDADATDTVKQPAALSDRPVTVAPLVIDYSDADYQVEWRYQPSSNQYVRWNGGEEQMDANLEEPLVASNIIIQRVPTTVLEPATGRLALATTGTGEAILFQDGAVYQGQWVKTERGTRTRFNDQAGTEWLFNPGNLWIEIVTTETTVTF